MKKIGISLVFCMSLVWAENMPQEAWKLSATANLTVSQSYYSDNWDGSQRGTVAWMADFLGRAKKQISPVLRTRNTLRIDYGQTKSQDEDGNWDDFTKTTDRIEYETLLLFSLNEWIEPFISAKVNSQFTHEAKRVDHDSSLVNPKYDLRFNPITITESFGVSRDFIAEENSSLSARLGGAFKQTIRRWELQEDGTYDDEFINDAGLELVGEYETNLHDDFLEYRSTLSLFTALASSEEYDHDDWKVPQVEWDNSATIHLTDYIIFRAGLELLYNKLIDTDVRLRQNMSLGIQFRHSN
ncbi:DUF3078 domain-containing protein [Chitinivibrio alkaliphilus]|uniref:DUF3078 domain-containing protein n=1 Tax=Chitinivibrio alkaliphilus ACht1 TaxID=1313304 RepID=U7DCF7_9BACT|nr:DUF3078 domain-containing protein [Chitinivibrio alkaliphilus]ERP39258.1 hypothetical protein CALK_0049 [Chitinivibrio alkaliphilus ACht1]